MHSCQDHEVVQKAVAGLFVEFSEHKKNWKFLKQLG